MIVANILKIHQILKRLNHDFQDYDILNPMNPFISLILVQTTKKGLYI